MTPLDTRIAGCDLLLSRAGVAAIGAGVDAVRRVGARHQTVERTELAGQPTETVHATVARHQALHRVWVDRQWVIDADEVHQRHDLPEVGIVDQA